MPKKTSDDPLWTCWALLGRITYALHSGPDWKAAAGFARTLTERLDRQIAEPLPHMDEGPGGRPVEEEEESGVAKKGVEAGTMQGNLL